MIVEYELGLIVGLTSNEWGTVSFHVSHGSPGVVKIEPYFIFQIYSFFVGIGILDMEIMRYQQAVR